MTQGAPRARDPVYNFAHRQVESPLVSAAAHEQGALLTDMLNRRRQRASGSGTRRTRPIKPRTAPPLLDPANAAFIAGGVSIVAASRTPDHEPQIARAVGCRVSKNRRRLTVLFVAGQAQDLLAAVRATRAIAVVFTQPTTHRTIQLKGDDAMVSTATRGERALVEPYATAFAGELGQVGYAPVFTRALLDCDAGDIVAITFTVAAAFSQTPGPRAGAPLAA